MDIYIWLFLLLSYFTQGYYAQQGCPVYCRCHPEGQIICQHRWFEGPLSPYFFRVVRNASLQLEIHMDHNKITRIPQRVFENFSSLRTLNFNDNQIQTLDPEAFFGLRQLRFLDIRNNSITELPIGLFDQQVQLLSLDLRQNSITRIQLQTLTPLVSLEQLALGDNPLICDCQTREILEWATSKNVSEGDPPITCIRPGVIVKIGWNFLFHVCLRPFNNSLFTTASTVSIASTIPSAEAQSNKPRRASGFPEPTTLVTNDFLYNSTPGSVVFNVSTASRLENMTNTANRTMAVNQVETHEIVTFVVVSTVLLILSVFVFVMCRRKRKRTRFKVMQDDNARSVPPPGRGQELLCDDDEEEGYEYVDLGKDSDTARYVSLSQENGVSKE